MINLVGLKKEQFTISSKFYKEVENSCNMLEKDYD